MSKDEILTLHMHESEGLTLPPIFGAAYDVQKRYMCTMEDCTIAWDIEYTN